MDYRGKGTGEPEEVFAMKVKEYFDLELISTILHAIAGCLVGYASFLINQPKIGFLLAIAVLAVVWFSIKKIWNIKKNFKWWLGNGIVVYLFLWLIVWTIFYTIQLRSTLP